MSASAELLSDSEESDYSDDPIEVSLDPIDGEHITLTLKKQYETEESITSLYERHYMIAEQEDMSMMTLYKDRHVAYLRKGLFAPAGVSRGLYAAQAWVVYWCLCGLALLDSLPSAEEGSRLVRFIKTCKNQDGGFGGGFGQISHLAPTYASILSLSIIGTDEAFEVIDREKLYKFLLSLKNEDGSFCMHDGGEVDVRASYIAMVCASLTNMMTSELRANVGDFIQQCQTYEGGVGSVPGAEAHGGYTFCGLAAMTLLDEAEKLNLSSLAHWAVQRQMKVEGGFQGRTNKLVDGCYSFWQGAVFPLLDQVYVTPGMYGDDPDGEINEAWNEGDGSWLCDQRALQMYILIAGQRPSGGLRDKPSQTPDYYHSCYVLSGLSITQHNAPYSLPPILNQGLPAEQEKGNIIRPVHPIYNIPPHSAQAIKRRFDVPYSP